MTLILKMKKFSYTIRKEENGDNLNDNKYEYEKDFMFLMRIMMMMILW